MPLLFFTGLLGIACVQCVLRVSSWGRDQVLGDHANAEHMHTPVAIIGPFPYTKHDILWDPELVLSS